MWFRSCSFLISMPDRYHLAYLGGQAPKCWKGGIQTILACFRSTVKMVVLCCAPQVWHWYALMIIDYSLFSVGSSCPSALEQRCDGHFQLMNVSEPVTRIILMAWQKDISEEHWKAMLGGQSLIFLLFFTATILPQLGKLLATDWQPPAYRARIV